MYAVTGSLVDALHAILMVVWVAGLPLLFWQHFPRVTRAFAIYAVGFVVVNHVSRLLLGECVLTTLSRALWTQGGAPPGSVPSEWFTVRFARAVFHMSPSHRSITVLSEALVLVTAFGAYRAARHAKRSSPPSDEAVAHRAATSAPPGKVPP